MKHSSNILKKTIRLGAFFAGSALMLVAFQNCGPGFMVTDNTPHPAALSSQSVTDVPNGDSSNTCQAGVIQACSQASGSGNRICNSNGASWSACLMTTCNSGYTLTNAQCVQNTQAQDMGCSGRYTAKISGWFVDYSGSMVITCTGQDCDATLTLPFAIPFVDKVTNFSGTCDDHDLRLGSEDDPIIELTGSHHGSYSGDLGPWDFEITYDKGL